MLDIKYIKENLDLVKAAADKKKINIDLDKLVSLDAVRLNLLKQIEALRAGQNEASKKIQTLDGEERSLAIARVKESKEELKKLESEQKENLVEWQELMWQVPNVPDETVPDGFSDEDNVQIKTWGDETKFEFEPKDHVDIMEGLGMVDFERGSKVHGFRGYYLKGDAVRLSFAIWQYALEFFAEKGFNPMLAPAIVREENLYGTGHLPNEADDVYKTQDNDYLAGTAEVPVMGYHSGEVLDQKSFPIKYLAFTPCYRREAGSHGKDTRGLIRVHEFQKWEQVILCESSHEESVKHHEALNRNTEEFIESLQIPYQTVLNCGGDLGQGQVKKYDIELWVPLEKKYREISSASYFHDFQTRRFNIRYKNSAGELEFAHSLNCTAIPTPRILVSLIENFQQEDGTIKVPDALKKYLGGAEFLGK